MGGGVFGLGNLGGRGDHSDPGNPGGSGGQKTLPSVGEVWIFSGITQCVCKHLNQNLSLQFINQTWNYELLNWRNLDLKVKTLVTLFTLNSAIGD